MVIQLTNISKHYCTGNQENFALKAINLEVQEGEFLIIMGPSGSGKSTLLNILSLREKPSSGVYSLYGQSVYKHSEELLLSDQQNCVSFISQENQLINEMTVFENIEDPLKRKGINSRDSQIRVVNLLERFSMLSKGNLYPKQLSYGQQRCVSIARALVTNPKLILADEPISYLDPITRMEVTNLLSELNREGATIVMATHTPHGSDIADRSVKLFDGQIISEKVNAPVDHKILKLFATHI